MYSGGVGAGGGAAGRTDGIAAGRAIAQVSGCSTRLEVKSLPDCRENDVTQPTLIMQDILSALPPASVHLNSLGNDLLGKIGLHTSGKV